MMKWRTPEELGSLAEKFGAGISGLSDELKAKMAAAHAAEAQERPRMRAALESVVRPVPGLAPSPAVEVAEERIVAMSAGARPVARILNNRATANFIGPDSESWGKVITDAKAVIDKAIPAVGRIELNNSDYPWAGTGWLIAPNVIVTNRHVAELFARFDRKASRFVFKPGLVSGLVSADIDFLEEENRLDSAEHPVTSVLWVAPPDEADVAFMQISKAKGLALPQPIELLDEVEAGTVVAAIGYPARDPSIRDQELVMRIFGPDVYDKKRLSPGKIMAIEGNTIKHDCSTLGGNSGSLLLELNTGRAVGIHRGGLVDDSANLGVTAKHLRELLVKAGNANTSIETVGPVTSPSEVQSASQPDGGSFRLKLHIPVEVVVNVGAPVQFVSAGTTTTAPSPDGPGAAEHFDAALKRAQALFAADPNVLKVRAGYRFKNGWITDERVIAVYVKQKLDRSELQKAGASALPREVAGIGVDIRTAPLPDQLEALGVDLVALERPGRPGGYHEPSGYTDRRSDLFLGPVNQEMDAIFHVSPDAGFANLKAFLERVESHLTATMYEWEPNHVSDAIEAAIKPGNRTLRMVTQKRGVGEGDATESAVEDMKQRIGDKFSHVWASVRGPHRLIPDSYHIKVASRDGEEFWLSSGNWKDSNQPENPATASALRKFNREWHAVIKNERLARLFQHYIEFDFHEATRVPLEEREAVGVVDIELFVPDPALGVSLERIPTATYEDELVLQRERLEIQPLLTPDRDAQGRRIFMKAATDMIQRATKSIYVQNQSFSLTDENNSEFDHFFSVLKQKQDALDDVRIIFRDAKDYHRAKDLERQQELIERLKDFGFDVSPKAIRLQSRCHTKGIIIDSKEVLLGSQNLTNGGSLFNRDASLLVKSPKVAAFFEKVFLFDWDNLTSNEADESIGGIRRADPGEPTPPGFRRMRLSELLADDS